MDVVGYHSTNGSSAYVPLTPGRILDTRVLTPALPPYGSTTSTPTPRRPRVAHRPETTPPIDFFNGSSGSTYLILDEFGYFAST